MPLPYLIRNLIPLRWQRTTKKEPLSMVILQREPHFFTAEELRRAGESAWRISFSGEDEKSMHCVVQKGRVTLMKSGSYLFSFFHLPTPYVDNPGANSDWLPKESQRQAWIAHTSCYSIDLLNDGISVQLGYSTLAQLVSELIDSNCLAVYLPRDRVLAPNDGTLTELLRKLATELGSGTKGS